ncbi:MAG TPA: multicopper oxidase domain-containing protein [Marmoricola sp.]|jgi:nitrite reductase (NO-forming)|nr:multicopper oxidase domain-containing protein [Marmoricola sp.]
MNRSRGRKGFSPIRDLPAVLWMLAVVAVALVHRQVPAPRWLLFHLLLLGAATHSIVVWSQHFTDALLHAAPAARQLRERTLRLALLNAGVVAVIAGILAERWLVTAAGATGVAAAVGWHAVALVLQLRHSLGSRFAVTVRYYSAAGALLPVGALLGVLMARGLGEQAHARVMVAHVELNVLGWIGLTVLGTLITLWPTMLRTRMDEHAVAAGRTALLPLVLGLGLAVAGTLSGVRPLATVGLLAYAGGIVVLAGPFLRVARQKPPTHFPTWSVLSGVCWLAVLVVLMAGFVGTSPDWVTTHERIATLTPAFAVGFVAQVLLGALSFLLPVNTGKGPAGARAGNTAFDKGAALRVTATNTGLLVFLLPVPSAVRVTVSVVVLAALASFLPLMFLALRASRAANAQPPAVVPRGQRSGPAAVAGERPPGQRTGQAVAGLTAVLLALAIGVAVDPQALGRPGTASAAGDVVASGRTTTVQVRAANMRFTPAKVDVPAGNRLVIELTNTDDEDVHDLVLDSGATSGRLGPGESSTVDVGVVGRDLSGWCSVVGHRQMGMVFAVDVTGLDTAARSGSAGGHHHGSTAADPHDAAIQPDLMADPGPGFTPYDASLPAPPHATVHRRTFTVTDGEHEVAPGVTQLLWTYDGTAPGPVLHGRVGDLFEITLVNHASMGHSIDFHAGERAPDKVMRTIPPGGSLVYRFRAERAGIWMYHCSTMPMSTHIANGLFGAVVIEPKDLPAVDRSYVLVQSELYLGPQGEAVDTGKVSAEMPDLVVFNGYANQYDHRPLPARVGERVRVWVLDAGPNRPSSFHVVGEQFDTVWSEGSYLLGPDRGRQRGGAQVLPLLPAQGGFVELEFSEPGTYPFVSHLMVDAERGAHGTFRVRP